MLRDTRPLLQSSEDNFRLPLLLMFSSSFFLDRSDANLCSSCLKTKLEPARALHGSALDNGSKWYGLGVPRFFKWYGRWYQSLRYLMVRLPTPRFFTVSQHCGKQMARYMVTFVFRGRQMARYMVTISLRGRQMVRYMVTIFLRGRQMARYMVLRSINFLRGRQTARLR